MTFQSILVQSIHRLKCIEYFDPDIKKMIIEKLCNQVIVRSLLFNLFGNYVLQKTIQYGMNRINHLISIWSDLCSIN